jgi:polyhydroxybutyrate depolymerase
LVVRWRDQFKIQEIIMSSLNPVRALSVAVVAVGIALVSAHGAPQVEASLAISPGTYDRTLEHGGITRRYVVHVPPQHDHGAPLPLVFALHGNGGRPEVMMRGKGIPQAANKHGFIAVFPCGARPVPGKPNGFGWVPSSASWRPGFPQIDDQGFFEALLDELEADLSIDPRRIYVTGFSNGGRMTHWLGAVLSQRVAAIAPVGATAGVAVSDTSPVTFPPDPPEAMPVLMINGKDDPRIPYAGGPSVKNGVVQPGLKASAADNFAHWMAANDCTGQPQVEVSPNGKLTRRWNTGVDGARVVLVSVEGLTHRWPTKIAGKPTIQRIWEFFEAHPKR